MAPQLNPIYDRSIHLFENFEKGPRQLTQTEVGDVERLKREIKELESRGASTKRRILDKFEVSMPFGVSSGPAYGSKYLDIYNRLGYGFLTQKTVRDRKWEGNPMPHTTYLEGGSLEAGFTASQGPTELVANSFGMNSVAPEVWTRDLKSFKEQNPGAVLVMSGVVTQAHQREDAISQYVEIGMKSEEIRADAYEVNVSCPNEMEGRSNELQDDTDFIVDVLGELTSKIKIPIFLKIGHRKDLTEFAKTTGKILDGRGALVAINSISAVIKNPDGSYKFGDKRPKAGVSYLPIADKAKESLAQLVKARQQSGYDFKIFSVGGVAKPEDVLERLRMGADAVESGAGAMTVPTLGLETRKYLLEQNLKGAF